MKEAHVRNSINYEMSTPNRGQILSADRGARGWPPGNMGRGGRNSSEHPADFETGSGWTGNIDPDNVVDDYDDAGRSHA